MGHNTRYNHVSSEPHYRHYISEICYRLGFEIDREDRSDLDIIWKIEGDSRVKYLDSNEVARNELWFRTWKKLLDEYSLHDESWAYGR